MELTGTHRVSFDSIRRLAIECHALDLAAHPLLKDTTHSDVSGRTRVAYEELQSSKLLALAIAIRTRFYQGLHAGSTEGFVIHSGVLYQEGESDPENVAFTIKDVCDKIIHAETITRDLESRQSSLIADLRGKKGKVHWLLSFSVSLFTEGVLNWLEHSET